ncbi:MAG TPA: phage tail sheath subtilisin-like domain-containing protein [Xanthobacteraceae bacterium]|nr:phage tail sheath subtilisin-like domain-containing protein [Xanthobacteraceae bacterium]
MPISFAQIPANWKLPLYWVEIDPSKAGLWTIRQPALLVGIMTDEGIAAPDVAIPIGSQAQADKQFGQGSHLANMFRAFFANNFAHEVWGLPVAEPAAGTAATGTITVSVDASGHEAGTIHLYIAGHHVPVNIAAADDVNDIHVALSAAINDDFDLPVSSVGGPTVVTLTCNWAGTSGNDIDVRDSYYGRLGSEELPKGVTIAYSTLGMLSGGAGVPVFDTAISNIGEREFEYVAMPFTDTTSLLAWELEYGFTDTGRWGWMRQLYGHIWSMKRATYADMIAFGETRNAGQTSIMGIELASPSPVWEWTAAYTAKAARGLTNDPARPLQTLEFTGILPAPLHERFNRMELNTFAGYGIATQEVGSNGLPMILRETTTYQLNLYGQGDDAYELATTLATLARLLRNQRQAITSKFPRHKLANDGTRFGPGQAIVTPGLIAAELVGQYRQDEYNGLVEDVRSFKENLLVERDPNNPNRVNVLYPPDLINQLRVFAVLAQFRLQYDRGIDREIIGGTRLAAGGAG